VWVKRKVKVCGWYFGAYVVTYQLYTTLLDGTSAYVALCIVVFYFSGYNSTPDITPTGAVNKKK
jgi:hypothetical protein